MGRNFSIHFSAFNIIDVLRDFVLLKYRWLETVNQNFCFIKPTTTTGKVGRMPRVISVSTPFAMQVLYM